jgi:hypothetical protein
MRYAMLVLMAALLAAGCADSPTEPEPNEKMESALEFLKFPADLLPLVQQADSFYAVAGEHRELVLRYAPETPGEEGEEFLTFDVPGDALYKKPDGSLFVRGDSVLIKVQVADDGRFLFRFEPSGLQFNPDHPAELEINYLRTEGDYDGDGDSDGHDQELEDKLSIWKQEAEGDPWVKVGTVKFEDVDEIEAKVFSFTGFAVAA